MPAVGFNTASQALLITGRDVYPATTLIATPEPNGIVRIASLANVVEFSGSYVLLTRLDGSSFNSQDEAMAYLNAEFSKVIEGGSGGTTQPIPTGYDNGII